MINCRKSALRLWASGGILLLGVAAGMLMGAGGGPAATGAGAATGPAPMVITHRAAGPGAIKALFVSGGCCHDYTGQMPGLAEGISKMANVEWTLVLGTGTAAGFRNPFFDNPDWAKGYDVVVHDECSADIKDVEYIRRVLKPHMEGTPAVVLHCAMHTYRNATNANEYREFLGVTTHEHEAAAPLEVKPVAAQAKHPIMIAFPESYKTPVNDEMYIILKTWPNMTPLATAYGKANNTDFPCVWTNQYGKARVFGTTLGHDTKEVLSETYVGLIGRGLLWACDKLGEDGKPKAGFEPKN